MDHGLLSAFRQRVLAGIRDDLAHEASDAEARRSEVIPAVLAAVGQARAVGQCRRAWLFGSFAWGLPGERSDVDVLVESCADPDSLAGDIWRATERPAHVVEIERAPASLVERVLRDGRPL